MKVKKELIKELSYLPDWIDLTNSLHYEIWHMIGVMNDTLLELVSLRVLSKGVIYGKVKIFYEYVIAIMSVLEEENKLTFSIYYTAVIEMMMDRCLDSELYEAMENIKIFEDLYYKKLLIEDVDNQ